MHSTRAIGRALLALFVLSGVAGLIYQSVWSNYLGLTLGHAAYAQSLVLAIFMGGMALGAWLASRKAPDMQRLIRAYAWVEILIGMVGLVFHSVFVGYTEFSQDVVLPALHNDGLAHAWQWSTAALLIAPQSVLLGMTFPLLSGGYLRLTPGEDGQVLGGLYFTNSIGAAFGALLCTFVLLPWGGMPGAVRVAGAINVLVGVLAWGVAAAIGEGGSSTAAPAVDTVDAGRPGGLRRPRWLLLAAGVTGATSFVYELGWVRLLNQALGTTVHAFELMLSAFILGLALGGLWVRRRSSRIIDPVAATGHAQVWMGIAALISVPVFTQSFNGVAWLMGALARNDSGYLLFNLGSAVIAMLVMLPAAFFAGMTLPLLTMALLRGGHGEASIGRVYAANTLGAIVGVFLTLHALIPAIGVGLSITLAATADLVLGLLLLRYLSLVTRWVGYAMSAACGVLALAFSLQFGRPDPLAQTAGVFRTGQTRVPGQKVVFLRDGKTATVSVFEEDGGYSAISTNGKPDAAINVTGQGLASSDEITMRMAAALPLALMSRPDTIAVIGWGSGMTTATLLGSPIPKTVTTIEIEPAMHDGARLLGPKVARGYSDPRSMPKFDDARTYFATGNRQFDVVISEPSNPWVSGVASLFTKEFYGFVHRHLRPGGLLVQWIQSYEIDDRLLSSMVAALVSVYPHVDVYLTNSADLMFVARDRPLPPLVLRNLSALQGDLVEVGLRDDADFRMRRIGSERILRAFVTYTGASPHSDFHPTVSLEGPRTRFTAASSTVLQDLVINGLPVLDVLEGRQPPDPAAITYDRNSLFAERTVRAWAIVKAMRERDDRVLQVHDPDLADRVRELRGIDNGASVELAKRWYEDVSELAGNSIGLLPADDLVGVWLNPGWRTADAPLPNAGAAVLAAFAAAASRDVAQLQPLAVQALQRLRADRDAPDQLREQMLVLAMLGAIGSRHPQQVGALESAWGDDIKVASGRYGAIRVFLQAWADNQTADRR